MKDGGETMAIDATQSVSNTARVQTVDKTSNTNQADGQTFRQLLASQNKDSAATSTSQSNKQKNITIRWGDTVSELAEEYKTSVAGIVNANHLQDPNFILAGHSLLIPGNVGQTAVNVKTETPSTSAISTKYVSATTNKTSSSSGSGAESTDEAQARAYVVAHESGGDYNARNGKYIGKYQLDSSYLKGDYSAANQERVANRYVAQRYGTWVKAMQHWKNNSWY